DSSELLRPSGQILVGHRSASATDFQVSCCALILHPLGSTGLLSSSGFPIILVHSIVARSAESTSPPWSRGPAAPPWAFRPSILPWSIGLSVLAGPSFKAQPWLLPLSAPLWHQFLPALPDPCSSL
ncbi:hypothetical protein M9458_048464, partial [Cirrhinus mrigala]